MILFAKTPDLSGSSEYPFTSDAKVKIMDMKFDRHTIEMDTNLDKPAHKEENLPISCPLGTIYVCK